MYPLLPWKWIGGGLTLVTILAVYADDMQQITGFQITNSLVIRYLPLIVLIVFGGVFAPTGYCAPWRILWRIFPRLNGWFPDLNGVWVGSTNSNWPTIKKLVEAAQSDEQLSDLDLHDIPDQRDAMAIRITNSLFKLQVRAGLSSTNAESFSITAKPWRHQHTGRVILSYVYKQKTPNYQATDEETHFGAANLELSTDQYSCAEGTYWTTRSWRTGRNTAGTLELTMLTPKNECKKSLQQYALEHNKFLSKE